MPRTTVPSPAPPPGGMLTSSQASSVERGTASQYQHGHLQAVAVPVVGLLLDRGSISYAFHLPNPIPTATAHAGAATGTAAAGPAGVPQYHISQPTSELQQYVLLCLLWLADVDHADLHTIAASAPAQELPE